MLLGATRTQRQVEGTQQGQAKRGTRPREAASCSGVSGRMESRAARTWPDSLSHSLQGPASSSQTNLLLATSMTTQRPGPFTSRLHLFTESPLSPHPPGKNSNYSSLNEGNAPITSANWSRNARTGQPGGQAPTLARANMAREARSLKHGTHSERRRGRGIFLRNEAVAPGIIAINLY